MSPRKAKPYTPKSPITKRLIEYFGDETFVNISQKTGISDSQISNIFKEKHEPPAKLLLYIADNGGDVNYILTGKKSDSKCAESVEMLPISNVQRQALGLCRLFVDTLLDTERMILQSEVAAENYIQLHDEILASLEKISAVG